MFRQSAPKPKIIFWRLANEDVFASISVLEITVYCIEISAFTITRKGGGILT